MAKTAPVRARVSGSAYIAREELDRAPDPAIIIKGVVWRLQKMMTRTYQVPERDLEWRALPEDARVLVRVASEVTHGS